ncbi:MAG: rod shape-determining protein MreC [Chloroflexi bacterium]|nr:rod shape-determining protein MreC [Chloroflexota bacterium]
MLTTRSSRRAAVLYAVLLAISILLLAISGSPIVREVRRGVGFALAPVQQVLTTGTRTVTSVFAAFGQVDELRRDNERLNERIQLLEVENRRLEQTAIENRRLTALLQLRSTLDYGSVAASVIARSGTESERIVTLDRGTDLGISDGDIVLAEGGALVGVVIEVGRNFSHVRLISDTRSVVVGLIAASRATGDVQGQLGRPLVMSRIPVTDVVTVRDTVVTAGIDLGNDIRSSFPKGLLIGTIVDVQQDLNAVVKTASVLPAAMLDRLEVVLVLTGYDGQPAPRPSGSPLPGASGSPGPSPRPSGSGVGSGRPRTPGSGSGSAEPTASPTLPPAP